MRSECCISLESILRFMGKVRVDVTARPSHAGLSSTGSFCLSSPHSHRSASVPRLNPASFPLSVYRRYYGFDPHDDSDNLRIHNNVVWNNGEGLLLPKVRGPKSCSG